MPWRKETGHAQCPHGVAVVKADTGEFVACHDSEEAADKHIAALYANEPEMRTLAALDEQREIRSATFNPVDVADDGSWFEGYAAVFDEPATFEIPGVGSITEEVRRGAFRRALAQGENIPMLYHHLQEHPPLATTRGGTLMLEEDAKGLRTRANVARGYIGDAVRELVKRGDIPGMSWGFVAGKGNSLIERRSGGIHRTLVNFKKILDVSPTWDVTYRGTEAQFRAKTFGMAALLPDELQQLGIGDRQQVAEQGTRPDGGEEEPETRSLERESDESGAAAPARSVAARKRALNLYLIETGGYDDAS